MKRFRLFAALAAGILLAAFASASADAANCPRPAASSEVAPPPDLYSSGGVLKLALDYQTAVDAAGRTLFCYTTPDGLQSPTLHVNPGDTILISLTNQLPPVSSGPSEIMANSRSICGDRRMTDSSVNMHFHGMNISPRCHSDEVVHTLVNSGQTFSYKLKIPSNEPPGLYWYHPHVHGISSASVEGGASGAIIVGGIENVQPAVAGLPERLLMIRDQPLLNAGASKQPQPGWDVSLNYVPVPYPRYRPASIHMARGSREFWRVANASANTIMDLQVVYDGKPQTLQVAALDGVPTGSQDGKAQGALLTEKHLLLPPAGRAEFILAAPSGKVADAELVTRAINGGPASDNNPARPLARILLTKEATHLPRIPERSGPPNRQRFADLSDAKVTANRTLFFSEVPGTIGRTSKTPPAEPVNFYITVQGHTPTLYDPSNAPAITTTKGAVEDWTIENHTFEVHEFHMHQIHFLLLQRNGKPVPAAERQFRDTVQVPFWNGRGPYPSVKVRMDFRGAVAGDFVYHCHILEHEDGGMMGIIRVLPKA